MGYPVGVSHILVPVTGLEPVRHRWRRILSPLRLPFHHTGRWLNQYSTHREKKQAKVFGAGELCLTSLTVSIIILLFC